MKLADIQRIFENEVNFLRAFKYRINVCCSSGCIPIGALKLLKTFENLVSELGIAEDCLVARTGCVGTCSIGPVVVVEPGEYIYQNVSPEKAHKIVLNHIVSGFPLQNLLYENKVFVKKQHRLVLRNAGKINPFRINDYIVIGGYSALVKCLTKLSPHDIIEEIKTSGLRGRGGAGFSTAKKWSFVARAHGSPKYIIANLDEGDPGVFANRTLAEADPHALIEGLLIAGYAIGAEKAFIYVRAEYPLAIDTLRKAISQAEELAIIGENVLGTSFTFDVELRLGAGAFVAGEETAIIASVEGRRAMPRDRPPYPATNGLWGKPTLIQNVETLANVPVIIHNGGTWFAKIGSPKCTGTKCFSITGKISNPGLIEVPMGITLREVIYDIGGGVPGNRNLKAVLVGGPSGGCIPDFLLDLPIDYESLKAAGAIMGSGGIVVIDNQSCLIDTASFFIDFCVAESCGKCTPCRVGLVKIKEIFERIMKGKGRKEDLDLLSKLSTFISESSLCGLGQTAPNPVLTMLRYFKEEYVAHLTAKFCIAGKCFKTENVNKIE